MCMQRNIRIIRGAIAEPVKMMRDRRMAGLMQLSCGNRLAGESPVLAEIFLVIFRSRDARHSLRDRISAVWPQTRHLKPAAHTP